VANSPRETLRVVESHQGIVTPTTISAGFLLGLELPEARWAVPDVLPEGVTILAGKPKIGKSWLALGLGVAVGSGGRALGKIAVEPGEALYMGLEDNMRRLQKRMRKMLAGREAPAHLEVTTEWPQLDEGGIEALAAWLDKRPDARLVVIDTLKKIRPREPKQGRVYDLDYEALEPLVPLASGQGVAILVVHHLRKLEAGDPLDMISGSTGLTGGVDGAMVLKRDRGKQDATLVVDGRDIEEPSEFALRWDADIASWSLMGDAEEYRQSEERRRIMGLLMRMDEPMQPKDIAEALEKNRSTTRVLLANMKQDGQVEDTGKGYVVAQHHKQAKQHKQPQQAKQHKQPAKSPAVGDAQSVYGVYGVYGDGGDKAPRLTAEEAEEVKRLIDQGMKAERAREAVLRKRGGGGAA
jgi:AAA domain/IclR helix-turn-helix domain